MTTEELDDEVIDVEHESKEIEYLELAQRIKAEF